MFTNSTTIAINGGSKDGLWGGFGSLKCLFHVGIFLTQLSVIGNIATWGATTQWRSWICRCLQYRNDRFQ